MSASLEVVTVILVTHDSLAAVQAQQAFLQALPAVLVVDNASRDGTPQWLRQTLPNVRVLALDANIGFGRAHNLGVAECATPFALLLNPDCTLGLDDLVQLVACLDRHPEALMAVPALVYPDGRAQENHRGFFHTRGAARPVYLRPHGELCCEMVSGAVLLVRVEAFRALGGFDPWFFLYWEDEELCIRARAARLAVILDPAATACHVAQTSSPPSLRGTFVRHYCYTASKLHLRRKLGEPAGLLVLRGLATLVTSLVTLPVNWLRGDRHKTQRSLARIAGVLTAPWQLRRARAVARPSDLWRERS